MSAKDVPLFQKGDCYVEQLKGAWSTHSSWVNSVTHNIEIYYAHKAFILILFFSFVSSFVRIGLARWILIFLLFCVFSVYTSTSEKQECGWGASKGIEMPKLEWAFWIDSLCMSWLPELGYNL